MNTFSTVMLIVAMMLNSNLMQPFVASDASLGFMSSYYVQADTITDIKPKIEITCEEVKTEGKKKVIFLGSVVLIRDDSIKFNADKVIIEASESGYVGHVEMIGRVWMTKPGLAINSQRARSDNFAIYIEFLEVTNMPLINGVKYWFNSGNMSYE